MKRGFTLIQQTLVCRKAKSRAFTLIEAMAVVSIIGILATLTIVVIGQAQRQARDTKRKSDLTAIALSFQARYDYMACGDGADVGRYPDRNSLEWKPVSDLATFTDSCGAFTEFLATYPVDPRFQATQPYSYNPSNESNGQKGKHYRLGARLEKTISLQESNDLVKMSSSWVTNFGGQQFPINYSFFIGK